MEFFKLCMDVALEYRMGLHMARRSRLQRYRSTAWSLMDTSNLGVVTRHDALSNGRLSCTFRNLCTVQFSASQDTRLLDFYDLLVEYHTMIFLPSYTTMLSLLHIGRFLNCYSSPPLLSSSAPKHK
jgi:hypothetical protein